VPLHLQGVAKCCTFIFYLYGSLKANIEKKFIKLPEKKNIKNNMNQTTKLSYKN